MNMRILSGEKRGFTLIEVSISMFFILFIVQGLAMVALYAQRSGIYARRLTSANILAEQAMEKYRNTDYDNIAACWDAQTLCFDGNMQFLGAPSDASCPITSDGCGSARAVFTETTTTAAGPVANLLAVTVNVTWTEGMAWRAPTSADGSYQAQVVSYISKF